MLQEEWMTVVSSSGTLGGMVWPITFRLANGALQLILILSSCDQVWLHAQPTIVITGMDTILSPVSF